MSDAWLDAVSSTRRVMVLTGADVAQLRAMLQLRPAVAGLASDARWMIDLHNTRSRVTTLHMRDALVRPDVEGAAWRELRDIETLARWLDARGFHAPFEAWKSSRGTVRSPRT